MRDLHGSGGFTLEKFRNPQNRQRSDHDRYSTVDLTVRFDDQKRTEFYRGTDAASGAALLCEDLKMIKQVHPVLDDNQNELYPATATRPLWSVWDRSSIASLSAVQISRMNRQMLLKLVEFVQNELPQSIANDRLHLLDRQTLERLSFVARRICRNRED